MLTWRIVPRNRSTAVAVKSGQDFKVANGAGYLYGYREHPAFGRNTQPALSPLFTRSAACRLPLPLWPGPGGQRGCPAGAGGRRALPRSVPQGPPREQAGAARGRHPGRTRWAEGRAGRRPGPPGGGGGQRRGPGGRRERLPGRRGRAVRRKHRRRRMEAEPERTEAPRRGGAAAGVSGPGPRRGCCAARGASGPLTVAGGERPPRSRSRGQRGEGVPVSLPSRGPGVSERGPFVRGRGIRGAGLGAGAPRGRAAEAGKRCRPSVPPPPPGGSPGLFVGTVAGWGFCGDAVRREGLSSPRVGSRSAAHAPAAGGEAAAGLTPAAGDGFALCRGRCLLAGHVASLQGCCLCSPPCSEAAFVSNRVPSAPLRFPLHYRY